MIQSMSRKGDCWDNAPSESFFKTLKVKRVYHRKYQNKVELYHYKNGLTSKNERQPYFQIWILKTTPPKQIFLECIYVPRCSRKMKIGK